MNKAVVIHIERKVGAEKFQGRQLKGSLPAILEGIAVLIQETAKAVDVPVGHLVSVLATTLLAPMNTEQRIVEDGGSDNAGREDNGSGKEERPEA